MKSSLFARFAGSKRWNPALALLPIVGTALLIALPARAEKLDAETQARIAKAESGPATIDVSGYPAPLQAKYKVFADKCAQCHKLSRPVNSDYVLPEEWERYIKRMMHKPDASFDKNEAKQIFDFLAYDSSVRKKDAFAKRLATATPEEKKAAEDKLKEIIERNK